ncbi:MAG: hypothetical protein II832_03005, partial [Synergistaceae bacterium]|nr:hypothetical protein [Synergistaceae bacterium]
HENKFNIQVLWGNVFGVASFQDSPYLILYSIMVILIVYTVCTVLELLRSWVFRKVSRGLLS